MKTSTRQLKVIALLFSLLILLQGCTVYKSANVSLEEAVRSDTQVRIKTNDNQTLKFKNVEAENGIYYGNMYKKSTWVKTAINEDSIAIVQVKDKTLSTVLSIAIPLVIIGGILVVAVDASLGGYGYL